MSLLEKLKSNLIIKHSSDDNFLQGILDAAISYAEGFQQLTPGFYLENPMTRRTEQGIIMLASHFYESRDGSTAGFFNDNINASNQVWKTVHLLLRMDKNWQI